MGNVRVRPGPFSLSLLTAAGHVYAFDDRGRLLYAFRNGAGYRRGLDNRVIELRARRDPDGAVRVVRPLDQAERQALVAAARTALAEARAATPSVSCRRTGTCRWCFGKGMSSTWRWLGPRASVRPPPPP